MMLRYFLILLFFFISYSSFSNEVVQIEDSLPERIFSLKSLSYYEDVENIFEINDVASEYFKNFVLNPSYNNKEFNVKATYWIKFSLKQNPLSEKRWLLEFYDQTIDEIIAYVPDGKGSFKEVKMGDILTFDERTFKHKNFELLIENNSLDELDYYFKIRSHNFADIRIALRSVDRFIYYALNEYFLFGVFYGMIFIISLYNLLMYFAIKERKYLYYIFYLLSVAVYAMCMDGIAYQYLWPQNPQWNQIAFGVFLFSIIFWSLLFSKRFLNLKAKAPVLNIVFKIVIALRTSIFFIALFFNNSFFDYQYIEIIPLILIFYTGIYVWSKGYKPARFFVIAYGLLFSGFFVKALVISGVLPFGIIMYYSLHICFLLEMLFLSFALGDRIRILKNKRDRAQLRIIEQHEQNVKLKDQINKELSYNVALKDKVNRELEQKVGERTRELDKKNKQLEEINHKLINQAKEISQINSILDLDNWKLKNNVKEALEDRFLNKNLLVDEFSKIFPNELACYRYLERIKWKDDFCCKKCLNEKFFEGLQKFSRRCTKCGYNESITAYTIFHGIKFPIDKAFYIAYITLNHQGKYTLEELSKSLNLRTNTIWSFKKKINNSFKTDDLDKLKSNDWSSVLIDPKVDSGKKILKRKQQIKVEI